MSVIITHAALSLRCTFAREFREFVHGLSMQLCVDNSEKTYISQATCIASDLHA